MTAASLAATVGSGIGKLTQRGQPDLARVTFKGDPMTFKELCKQWAADSSVWHGNGHVTAYDDIRNYTDTNYAFELYGDINDGTKRPLPTAKVWIECRASSASPGVAAPNSSRLKLTIKLGEWSKVASQVHSLLDYLRQGKWLDEPK